ncbi:endonuclease domain-containing protein [Ekhidna sp.]|uniref:endonuclease domain-containing protein n=1 Tax=Ekhidna sp. TaxID=2608089 RepID=UPI003C7ADFF9
MNKAYWDEIKSLARELRKRQTESEKTLWQSLRNRKFLGIKFFRQHPIVYHQFGRDYFFIADFYSAEINLVIELDGKIHEQQKEYDHQRDLIIKSKGLKVLRLRNECILKSIGEALEKIEGHITHPDLRSPLSNIREGKGES